MGIDIEKTKSMVVSKIGISEKQTGEKHQVYTDAPKQINGVGCAFFILISNVCAPYRLNENTSIFSAEAIVIEYIKEHSVKNAVIISDSLSVLMNISQAVDIFSPHINPNIMNLKMLLMKLMGKEHDIILI
ncbi:hypothetical protein JTB14_024090 [Gonioctena quinquepunctata]|nr:hypothetical protein JTB14_024090 [Gonioctena quinquepunctata]